MDKMGYKSTNTQAFNENVSRDERQRILPSLFPLPADAIWITKEPALDFTTLAPEKSTAPLAEPSSVNDNEKSARHIDRAQDFCRFS